MKQYLDLCKLILKKGILSTDRTGTGTISYFGTQSRYNLEDGFPLITTKKVYFRAIIYELIWMINGDTNIKYLLDNNVNIWNEWPYNNYIKSTEYKNESIKEFCNKVKIDNDFKEKWGNIGPVYGKQWRNFGGVDQLKKLISDIKEKPNSRRLIISAWNPPEIKNMKLPPCHAFMQFYVRNNKISCQLYQRSGDIFLGVPFNIASYSLLLTLIAHTCNLEIGEFIHTIGDAHIYNDHIDKIKLQIKRKPLKLCKIQISKNLKSIFDIKYKDIKIINYKSHPPIKGKVSV